MKGQLLQGTDLQTFLMSNYEYDAMTLLNLEALEQNLEWKNKKTVWKCPHCKAPDCMCPIDR